MSLNKKNKITIGAVIGMGLLNPFTQAVLHDQLQLVLTYVSIACAIWVAGYLVYSVTRPEVVNIPKKGAKTLKAGKLIET